MEKMLSPEAYRVEKIVNCVSRSTGHKVTASNYHGWMDGERGYTKFDRIIRGWFGAEMYREFEIAACLGIVVEALAGVANGEHFGLNMRNIRAKLRRHGKPVVAMAYKAHEKKRKK